MQRTVLGQRVWTVTVVRALWWAGVWRPEGEVLSDIPFNVARQFIESGQAVNTPDWPQSATDMPWALQGGETRSPGASVGSINGQSGDIVIQAGTGIAVATVGPVITITNTQTPATPPVASVFGRTGAVVAQAGDYNATEILLQPPGATWTTVQQAIEGLDAKAVPNTVQVIAGAGLSGGGPLTGNVTLTANVTSVFGRTGAIVAASGDYAAGQIALTPPAGTTWTDVQTAVTNLTLRAAPAGAARQIQFHNGLVPAGFGATAELAWNDFDDSLDVDGDIALTGTIWMDAIQVNLGSPVTVEFAVATPSNSGVGINLGSINSISTVTGGVLTVYASTTNINGPVNAFNGITATWDIEVYNLSAFPANIAFFVDADLQRAGIRTLAPEWPLDVDGDAGFRRNMVATNLPTVYPGAGSKQFWADPADSYTVKFAI